MHYDNDDDDDDDDDMMRFDLSWSSEVICDRRNKSIFRIAFPINFDA